jgi:hypothetical protein
MTEANGTADATDRVTVDGTPLARPQQDGPSADDFRESFGEDLHAVLDMANWRTGVDLALEYHRVEREVQQAVADEDAHQRNIRAHVFPRLEARRSIVPNAGMHVADRSLIAAIHRDFLFNGGLEACDGVVQVHDTIPLTIYQVSASLVSYHGDQNSWSQRFFRKDLRQRSANPVAETIELLERRARRATAEGNTSEGLGELVQRALLTYVERAILVHHAQAVWRMGHGNPVTYELLTGGGILELMVVATTELRQLIERHRKFVFVAGEPRERMLLTIGQALRPMEYAIVGTLDEWLHDWFDQLRFRVNGPASLDWDDEPIAPVDWIPRFIDRVAAQVVVGVFRASPFAPAQLFYAHADHAPLAAHIVLADSVLQEGRGFPLLLDHAQRVCRSVYGGGSLPEMANAAYSAAGAATRYFTE